MKLLANVLSFCEISWWGAKPNVLSLMADLVLMSPVCLLFLNICLAEIFNWLISLYSFDYFKSNQFIFTLIVKQVHNPFSNNIFQTLPN